MTSPVELSDEVVAPDENGDAVVNKQAATEIQWTRVENTDATLEEEKGDASMDKRVADKSEEKSVQW